MSYRSDVFITVVKGILDEESVEDLESISTEFEERVDSQGRVYQVFFLEEARWNDREDIERTLQEHPDDSSFIRVGEEFGDVESMGSFNPCNAYPTQMISFCIPE